MINVCESNNFTIEPITSKLGIFVEEIADLRLSNTEWKVVTRIDLNYLTNEYANIKLMIKSLNTKCKNFNSAIKEFFTETDSTFKHDSVFFCVLPTIQINALLQDIDESSHRWFIDEHVTNRKKRAILNILGGILLGAAGVGFLSDNNAEFYMNEFNRLHASNKDRDIYLNKQTILIESIFHQLNNTDNNISQMNKQINEVFWN